MHVIETDDFEEHRNVLEFIFSPAKHSEILMANAILLRRCYGTEIFPYHFDLVGEAAVSSQSIGSFFSFFLFVYTAMSPKDEILNDRRYEWTNNIESSVSSHYCGMECEAWHKRENGRRKHEKRHTHASDRGRESEKSTVNCCVQKYLLWFVSALFGRPFAWYRFGIVIVVALLLCIHAWIARMYFVLCASKTNSHFIFYFYFHCDTFLLLVHTKFHWNSYCICTTNSYLLFFCCCSVVVGVVVVIAPFFFCYLRRVSPIMLLSVGIGSDSELGMRWRRVIGGSTWHPKCLWYYD